jgi:hypothetical protein
MCNELIKAIRATEAYVNSEEVGVVIVAARSLDMCNRWFRVEGVRRAFRRVYVVDCSTPNGYVVEVVGGSQWQDEADLINYALKQKETEKA